MRTAALLVLGALCRPAAAVREPSDYRRALFQAAASELEALNAAGRFEEAIEAGERFLEHVAPAAPVAYEMAYAHNRLGRHRAAIKLYDRAIALDPELAIAYYDRGELRLLDGDNEGAKEDFLAAARLRPDHWAVHFRLAHMAGRERDVQAFEEHLIEALRHGFDFRSLVGDPEWQAWASDPELGRAIRRILVVYSDESILEELKQPPR